MPTSARRPTWHSPHIAAICCCAVLLSTVIPRLSAAERAPLVRVTFADDAERTRTVEGKVVVEAADGGILLLGRDGRLWTVPPRRKQNLEPAAPPQDFSLLSADELGRALVDELGDDFEIVRTKHYVIATSAGRAYADWTGELFERLLAAFLAHWKGAGLNLAEPAGPLPAIVFGSEKTFKKYAAADAGSFGEESKGYYSIRTNRIALYDLTAGKGAGGTKKRATSTAEVKRRTAAAAFNIATVVHEATHQIAFNSGLHVRLADNPLWLTEGMAMYFETAHFETGQLDAPDKSPSIGQINRPRLNQFLEFARRRRRRDSLATLVSQTDRFTNNSRQAADAYAEAWALTYFLITRHRDEYVAYVKVLSHKTPLVWDEPGSRLSEFQSAFGEKLPPLDAEFLRFMKSLPKR